mmetsp:Transcript_62816/g.183696  ORF Transcript_62816/g.183696 Transcript_62816/m.183696 type:complete len:435 (-) Transcript_62816:295-1599(-)
MSDIGNGLSTDGRLLDSHTEKSSTHGADGHHGQGRAADQHAEGGPQWMALESDTEPEAMLRPEQVIIPRSRSRTLGGREYPEKTYTCAAILVLLGMAVAGACAVAWGGHGAKHGKGPLRKQTGPSQESRVEGGPAAEPVFEVPAAGGLVDGFCGISANPSLCERNLMYLNSLGAHGSTDIFCKELNGEDPCSLAVADEDFGLGKNPFRCNVSPGVVFLWDHPGADMDETGSHAGEFGNGLCGAKGLPTCEVWAAEMWKRYVDKWLPQLTLAREIGVRVTSPRFQGEKVLDQFAAFFAACPECSQKGSKYYIDILAFNAWVANPQRDNGAMAANVSWIKSTARKLKGAYANRPVVLANFGSQGAHSAFLQAEVIEHSGLFKRGGSVLDAVYYFAAVDFHTVHNFLEEVVQEGPRNGTTIGQVLTEVCSGNVRKTH